MNSEILIYQNPDGNIKIDVRLEEETFVALPRATDIPSLMRLDSGRLKLVV